MAPFPRPGIVRAQGLGSVVALEQNLAVVVHHQPGLQGASHHSGGTLMFVDRVCSRSDLGEVNPKPSSVQSEELRGLRGRESDRFGEPGRLRGCGNRLPGGCE